MLVMPVYSIVSAHRVSLNYTQQMQGSCSNPKIKPESSYKHTVTSILLVRAQSIRKPDKACNVF
jgi:hypothetical protein